MLISRRAMPHLDGHTVTPATLVLEQALEVARTGAEPRPVVTREAVPFAGEVARLPRDLLRLKLEELVLVQHADMALQWLHDVGVLALVLPELEATVNFSQEMGRRHKDVWKHTKQVVIQAAPEAVVRWAALFHDIGKVPTRASGPGGKVTFHGHPEVGARMFEKVARRLGFPGDLKAPVKFLVANHLRANQYDGTWTDSAVRRFDREMGDHLPRLFALSRADITSARQYKRKAAVTKMDELARRIEALREMDARVPPLPTGLGNAIMKHFGLPPSRLIGDLMKELTSAVEAGELEAQQEPGHYLEYLEERGVEQ